MSRSKQTKKGRGRRRVVTALGAVAGALSLAGGASASSPVGDMPTQNIAPVILGEEEISDVSLGDLLCLRQRKRPNTRSTAGPVRQSILDTAVITEAAATAVAAAATAAAATAVAATAAADTAVAVTAAAVVIMAAAATAGAVTAAAGVITTAAAGSESIWVEYPKGPLARAR